MDQPPAIEASAVRRRWTGSVVVDLVIALFLGYVGVLLAAGVAPTAGMAGGALGLGLAFVIAGCRTSSGRLAARARELYLCLASVCMGLEIIRCLLIASGRNPDCSCEATAEMAARAWSALPESVGYELVMLGVPAILVGGIAWLIRRFRLAKATCAN